MKNFTFLSFLENLKNSPLHSKISCENPEMIGFFERTSISPKNIPTYDNVVELYHSTNSKSKSQKKWTMKEKTLLVWVIYCFLEINEKENHMDMNKNDWKQISVLMQRTWVDCCFKYHSLLKSSTQIQEWSPEEDSILSKIVKLHRQQIEVPFKWIDVAKDFYLKSPSSVFRNEKACREHWITHLDNGRKTGPWTITEDITLLLQVLKNQRKWLEISKAIKGRNCYEIKNRFCSLLTKFRIQEDDVNFNERIVQAINFLKSQTPPVQTSRNFIFIPVFICQKPSNFQIINQTQVNYPFLQQQQQVFYGNNYNWKCNADNSTSPNSENMANFQNDNSFRSVSNWDEESIMGGEQKEFEEEKNQEDPIGKYLAL